MLHISFHFINIEIINHILKMFLINFMAKNPNKLTFIKLQKRLHISDNNLWFIVKIES